MSVSSGLSIVRTRLHPVFVFHANDWFIINNKYTKKAMTKPAASVLPWHSGIIKQTARTGFNRNATTCTCAHSTVGESNTLLDECACFTTSVTDINKCCLKCCFVRSGVMFVTTIVLHVIMTARAGGTGERGAGYTVRVSLHRLMAVLATSPSHVVVTRCFHVDWKIVASP